MRTINFCVRYLLYLGLVGCELTNDMPVLNPGKDTHVYKSIGYYNSIDIPYRSLEISLLGGLEQILVTADDSGFATVRKMKMFEFRELDALLTIIKNAPKTCYAHNEPMPLIGSAIMIDIRQQDGTHCTITNNIYGVEELNLLFDDVRATGVDDLPVETATKIQ